MAMAGNIAGNESQGEFPRVENKTLISRCE